MITVKQLKRRPLPAEFAHKIEGYEKKVIVQRVESQDLFEDLVLDPPQVPWIFLDNIITRVLARMVGQGPYGPVVAKCTEDGSLAVVARGGAFSRYLVKEGNATDAGVEVDLGAKVSRIDIFTYDNAAIYKLARDEVIALGDEIELFKDSFYSLDVYTRRIWVKNKTPGLTARYRFIGWYD